MERLAQTGVHASPLRRIAAVQFAGTSPIHFL